MQLEWEGCLNVRDIGGHPTEDGAVTRRRVVVRADALKQLSDAGWTSLVDYGIARIVDLRFHDEREADPPRELPVEVVHLPLLGDTLDPDYWAFLNEHLDDAEDAASYLRFSYVDFLERFDANFAQALRAIADASGTVLVHCMGGKDRTGLVVALLLRLAGVSRDRIDEDYAISEINLAPEDEEWVRRAPDELERLRRSRLIKSPAGVMRWVLTELEGRCGSVPEYLLDAGLTATELAALRERLRERA
jgi:protein tyrosine/serine phosphatase